MENCKMHGKICVWTNNKKHLHYQLYNVPKSVSVDQKENIKDGISKGLIGISRFDIKKNQDINGSNTNIYYLPIVEEAKWVKMWNCLWKLLWGDSLTCDSTIEI